MTADGEPDRELLTELVLRTFRLNGLFLARAETLAEPAGLTAAWWQVLGAVLRGPRTVAEVGRSMGLSRQAVQRVANVLVDRGLCEFRPNPAHARAKLLAPTDAGRASIGRLRDGTVAWAREMEAELGADRIRQAVQLMDRLIEAMTQEPTGSGAPTGPR